MVNGYLMYAKSNFEKVRENLTLGWDDNNYKIYVPERNCIIGFFTDATLNILSDESFCKTLSPNESFKLNEKILKNKFVRKFEVSDNLLENVIIFDRNLKSAESKLKYSIIDFKNFIKI